MSETKPYEPPETINDNPKVTRILVILAACGCTGWAMGSLTRGLLDYWGWSGIVAAVLAVILWRVLGMRVVW